MLKKSQKFNTKITDANGREEELYKLIYKYENFQKKEGSNIWSDK